MLGFAVVDEKASDGATVVWLTSRIAPARAGHTNAVVLAASDERREIKIHSLVADRVAISLDGSGGLSVTDLDDLLDEAEEIRRPLTAAARTKLPARPEPLDLNGIVEPKMRVLATANYVAKVWQFWLATGEKLRSLEEMRERAAAKLDGRVIAHDDAARCADFPPAFGSRLNPAPVR